MDEWEINRNIEKKLGKDQKPLNNEELTIELATLIKKTRKMGYRLDEHGSALWTYFILIVVSVSIYLFYRYVGMGC